MVSRLYEGAFDMYVVTSSMTPGSPQSWTASGNGSWSRACWPSTSMEKMPDIISPVRRCISRRARRGIGIPPYKIYSRF